MGYGTNSSAPMSQVVPVGRGSPSKSVGGAPVQVPASIAGEGGQGSPKPAAALRACDLSLFRTWERDRRVHCSGRRARVPTGGALNRIGRVRSRSILAAEEPDAPGRTASRARACLTAI